MHISVLCNSPEQLEAAIDAADRARGAFGEIAIEGVKFDEAAYRDIVRRCHAAGCACALAMPYIFRDKAERWLGECRQYMAEAGFDGYIIRSLSEFSAVEEIEKLRTGDADMSAPDSTGCPYIKADYNLYAMNCEGARVLRELGADILTAPVELNERELHTLNISEMELLVFGRIPMTISAQCIKKAFGDCKKPGNVQIKDRTGKIMPVENVCRVCYNINYNSVPLSMIALKDRIMRLSPMTVRISLTIEDGTLSSSILKAYAMAFAPESYQKPQGMRAADPGGSREPKGIGSRDMAAEPVPEYTRGHFSRGVE